MHGETVKLLTQIVMLQSLNYLLCDLLLRNLYSAVNPDFRKFFIDVMYGGI